jgi:hypothetical protein
MAETRIWINDRFNGNFDSRLVDFENVESEAKDILAGWMEEGDRVQITRGMDGLTRAFIMCPQYGDSVDIYAIWKSDVPFTEKLLSAN